MSSFLLLSGLFIYQCQKTDLSSIPAVKQKNENTFNTKNVEEFVETINTFRKGNLVSRSGSYTFAELLNNVSNGISFEYNHPSKFQNEKFQFLDTVEIINAHDSYTTAQAATVYQAILDKATQQAGNVASAKVYLISIGLNPILSTTFTHKIEVYGTYANNTLFALPPQDTIYMPSDRFFEIYGSCEVHETDEIAGAAAYLTQWLKRKYINFPMQPNTYIGNAIILENAHDWDDDWWNASHNYHYSHSFKLMLLELNPNDLVPEDGHLDYVTYGYRWKKDDTEALNYGTCVYPSELSYYANNTFSIINTQLAIHSKDVCTWFDIGGKYQPDKVESSKYQFLSWRFLIWINSIISSDNPIPEKNILTQV